MPTGRSTTAQIVRLALSTAIVRSGMPDGQFARYGLGPQDVARGRDQFGRVAA